MKFIANFLSVIFFPLFIPIYGAALLFSLQFFYNYYPKEYILRAFIAIAAFGVVVPLFSILVLRTFKVISSMGLEKQRDRFLPYFCTAISYIVCAWVLFELAIPTFVSELIIAVAIALLMNAVITIWWKISAHTTGMGGLLGGILFTSYYFSFNPYCWILAAIFACGLVAAARLYLNAHTPGQVIAGLFNGLLCTLIIPSLNLGCKLNIWS